MRARFLVPVQPVWALCLVLWSAGPLVSAQTPPSLTVQLSAGQPTLTITGTVGTVYCIQYATDLSTTSPWTDRTLVQVQGVNTFWTDPNAPTPSKRFYRAVSVSPPVDTNLVFIQPGTFTMGSPTNEALRSADETQHVVTISRGFWMEKYLVSQGDYLNVVGSNPSRFTSANGYSNDPTRPVEQVSWNDATNFCALRTQQDRAAGLIPTNYAYRLPTESEWEYAARGGTTTPFYLGCDLYSGEANFVGTKEYRCSVGATNNPTGIYLGITTSVGSYSANPWGLYDMIGNVAEWCQDWRDSYPSGRVTDPQGAITGSTRVFRGGYWFGYAWYCRSAQRSAAVPTGLDSILGFRVVLALGQP